MQGTFEQELQWTRTHMPISARALGKMQDLKGVRLACSIHLDIKMIVALEGFIEKGAKVFLTTCNPNTVRDEVVNYLKGKGADAFAWKDMSPSDYQRGIEA